MPAGKQNGEMDVEIGKGGIHIHFTNTPKWAFILISIGVMFMLTFIGHAVFSYYAHKGKMQEMATKIAEEKPLSDKDIKFLETLPESDMKQLQTDVRRKMTIESDGLRVEQNVAPGTKVTIEKDGKKTSITKGGQ